MKILEFKGNQFILVRTLDEGLLIEDYSKDDIKNYYKVDTILKREGVLYLCNRIEDAIICEENQ
jgi:hypothetical protein